MVALSAVEGQNPENSQNFSRQALVDQLESELKGQSVWTLFCHETIAGRLGLNPTDHKCLDLIIRSEKINEPVTPGQLARETRLTTGAVTGILDRLEQGGFVQRVHDPDDRRRVILRPDMHKIHADVLPLIESLSHRFQNLCNSYSEDELNLLIEFAQKAQLLLREATEAFRELPTPVASVSA